MALTPTQRRAAGLMHAGRSPAAAAKLVGVETAEVERWALTKTWRAELARLARAAEEGSIEVKRRGRQLGLRVLARAAAGNLDPGACPACGRGDLADERLVSVDVQVHAAGVLAALSVEPLPAPPPPIPETALAAAEERYRIAAAAVQRNTTNAAATMAGLRQLQAAYRDVVAERERTKPRRALTAAELTAKAVDGALRLPPSAQEAVYRALGAALGMEPASGTSGVQ